jgi:hypothetical protein
MLVNFGTFEDPHEMEITEMIYHVLAPSILSMEIIHLLGIVIRYQNLLLPHCTNRNIAVSTICSIIHTVYHEACV